MAAGPSYLSSQSTQKKTALPTVTPLLRVTQTLPSNGCFFISTAAYGSMLEEAPNMADCI
jgi:hypothetical protein